MTESRNYRRFSESRTHTFRVAESKNRRVAESQGRRIAAFHRQNLRGTSLRASKFLRLYTSTRKTNCSACRHSRRSWPRTGARSQLSWLRSCILGQSITQRERLKPSQCLCAETERWSFQDYFLDSQRQQNYELRGARPM